MTGSSGHRSLRNWVCLFLAVLSALSMWLYLQRVLIPYQVSFSAVHGRPRGNLSDLYPRWIGARELLLHRKNPYSHEVTIESQKGYYGRPLDPTRDGDPKDEQGFAYPIYVVFLLAPLVGLPFAIVQKAFFWFLLASSIGTVILWLRILRITLPLLVELAVIVLAIGSCPVGQGLKLQQITLIVAGLVAAALALLISDRPFSAGALLALATIKPQLVWLLLIWLGIWTMADWRKRYRWLASFSITLSVLVGASEYLQRGWMVDFWHGMGEYLRYTRGSPVMDVLLPAWVGHLICFLAVLLCLWICWKNRRGDLLSCRFIASTSLALALTVLVVPTFAPYNQVLLIPSLFLLARDWSETSALSRVARVLLMATFCLLIWPWVSSFVISVLSFWLAPEQAQLFWNVPFWSALHFPIAVTALMLVYTHRKSAAVSREHSAS